MLFLDYKPELNELELEIYKYVATHVEKVVLMRIREVAEAGHCSTASVLRFCRKFECNGFSEFKVKLRIYLEETAKNQNTKTPDASSLTRFISQFPDKFYEEKINACIELLNGKELVWFLGYGSSNIVAEYGAMYFSSLVKMAINISDTFNHPMHYFGNIIAENTCVIVLSVSGETQNIIKNLDQFITSNTAIISITNSADSTIAKLSDINIPYYIAPEKIGDSDVTSQVPAIYILEYLVKACRKRKLE